MTSRKHGKVFYYKRETNETSWDAPGSASNEKALLQDPTEVKAPTTTTMDQDTKETDINTAGTLVDKPTVGTATPASVQKSPNTGRAAPLGPASWRSAQPQAPGPAAVAAAGADSERRRPRSISPVDNNKRSVQPNTADQDRNVKRTRMASPPKGPASGGRYAPPSSGAGAGPRSEFAPRRTFHSALEPLQTLEILV